MILMIPGKGIKNERIKLGEIQTDLITQKKSKQARIKNKSGYFSKLSISKLTSYRIAKNCFTTVKKIRIKGYILEVKLIFNRLLPIPISGEIKITTTKRKTLISAFSKTKKASSRKKIQLAQKRLNIKPIDI